MELPVMAQGEEGVVALVGAVLGVLMRYLRRAVLVALVGAELVMKILMVQAVVEAEAMVVGLALVRVVVVVDLMDLEVLGAV